jgi:hypothetical protein
LFFGFPKVDPERGTRRGKTGGLLADGWSLLGCSNFWKASWYHRPVVRVDFSSGASGFFPGSGMQPGTEYLG